MVLFVLGVFWRMFLNGTDSWFCLAPGAGMASSGQWCCPEASSICLLVELIPRGGVA